MLSEHADEIINDINRVRKKEKNIEFLLQKYYEKEEKDFIQKYIETKIVSLSLKDARMINMAFFSLAIISLILSLASILFFDSIKTRETVFSIILVLYFILLILIVCKFIKEYIFGKDNIYEKIILEIEDSNMPTNMETKPDVNSKLDAIISNVNEMNSKIDALEKKVNIKIENDLTIDDKENKFWTVMIALFVLIFTIYPMINDFTENSEKTKNILILTLIYTFILMVGAKLFYTNFLKMSVLYHRIRRYLSNVLHKRNHN